MAEPTQERLRELFDHNPETGIFIRRATGAPAGGIACRGYKTMRVDGRIQRQGRMAWIYMNGTLGEAHVDHINGDRSDDRIANLRAVTQAENNKNLGLPKHNRSGVIGVYWHQASERWRAGIRANRKHFTLGEFRSKDDAIAARKAAEAKLGFHENHGRTKAISGEKNV